MKRRLFKSYLHTKRRLSGTLLKLFFSYFRVGSPRFSFVFDSTAVADGFGAQFHRICSLIHASNLIQGEIQRPRISQVAIHPLDPYKSITEMETFLVNANTNLFGSSKFSHNPTSEDKEKLIRKRIDSLNISTLIKLRIKYCFSGEEILLTCKDAHAVADAFPNSYQASLVPFFEFLIDTNAETNNTIVLHIRQGHGNFAVYPGQKISRELPIEYFDSILDSIISTTDVLNHDLIILTDAPIKDMTFSPPPQQEYLWEGMPGYDGVTLTHLGRDLEQHFKFKYSRQFSDIKLIRDIDPVGMIHLMTRADFLGVSRSSLSFIAGILNSDGVVFAPPDFWHPSPKLWRFV